MMAITRTEIESVLGPVDAQLAAEITATNATLAELATAFAWLNGDDTVSDKGRPPPSGRVADVIGILESQDDSLLD